MPEGLGVPLAFAVYVPTLALRMTAGFFRFLGTRRTAVKTFRDALVAGGLPRAIADPPGRSGCPVRAARQSLRRPPGPRWRLGSATPRAGLSPWTCPPGTCRSPA